MQEEVLQGHGVLSLGPSTHSNHRMWSNTKNLLKKNKTKPKTPQNQHAHANKQKRVPSKKASDRHSLPLWDGHITVLAETLYFCSAIHNWHEWGDTESHWLNPEEGLVQVRGLQYHLIRLLESLLALTLLDEGCSLRIKMQPANRVDCCAWLSVVNQEVRLCEEAGRCNGKVQNVRLQREVQHERRRVAQLALTCHG